MNIHSCRIGALIVAAASLLTGITLTSNHASAGVVFSEDFEAPVVSGYANNTVPSGGKWIGSTQGYGSNNRGLYSEIFAWPATSPFTTPYGYQAYYLNYGGAGLTTAVGATGQTLTAGVTYKVGFNTAVAAGTATGNYQVELVAFGAADDNTTRANCTSTRPGTILASSTGTVTTTNMSVAPSIVFTPAAGNAHLGKELGIRIIKSTNSVLYDNIRLVVGHDMAPSPASGVTVPSGSVALSWTNMPPNTGTDTYVDVWFGTNPLSLAKVVSGGLNTSTTSVSSPVAGTYYWRVDSYLNGSATGTPVTGDLFVFYVIDSDNDGFPDTYELANTTPSSSTALNPNDDLDSDGLTNLQEYTYGTGPNNPDTDGDTLLDGPEINGTAGSRPATNPLLADTDADGLSDAVETNTGVWTNATNTGTNPVDSDWDNDGLKDGIETKTGTFVSRTTDTGTDPYLADTDNDGAGDWYEVAATFTNPSSAAQKSPIPYPLPDPDGSTGVTNKPVKVYIMSGQSNMVGIGYINGTAPGSLETIAKRENKFPNLVTDANAWTKRQDVIYKGVITATASGPLTAGQGSDSTRIGPELGFGHVMGWYHDEPVLLIKASQGNRGLFWDILPPASPGFSYTDGYTYAGYGQAPNKWLTAGGAPSPFVWYAGKQYDDFFLAENDMGCVTDWANSTSYSAGIFMRHNGVMYTCKTAHTSTPESEPGVGAQSSTYWTVYSVFNVTDVLDNFATQYPQWAAQGFQIAGYVWFQGNWDIASGTLSASRYETNLTQFIKQLRGYYANRYPGKCSTSTPFVLATGCGDRGTTGNGLTVANAQLAMNDPVKHPEFAGNVKTMDTRGYWRELSESPGSQGYHYNNNAETYMLTGDALARGMIDLQEDSDPPSPNPPTFATAPTPVNSTTVGMVANTASDVSGPVEYYFENTTNTNNSGWITSTTWINTGLTNGVSCDFRFKARDNKGNETAWSSVASAAPGSDVTAPLPDPMTFASPPAALGENSITMTAAIATDLNGVEYFFDCTTPGGHDSAWQDSPTYTDTGLSHSTQYTYQVRARDKSTGQNATAFSSAASATTAAPDSTPPTPGVMTFATPPAAQGENSITMTAVAASDASGVEYFFDCLTPGGHDSGWQSGTSYTDTGLNPSTQYTYQVQARDKSPAQNANTASAPASATTDAPDFTPPSVLSLNPADNSLDVAVATNLVVTFDEPVTTDTGFITIKNLSDSTQTAISINDPQVNISGSVVTINPTASLLPGKNYAVRIDATAFQDLAGNPFAGINDDTTWNFTAAVVPYVWTLTTGGAQSWETPANWQGGNVPNPVAGDTVDFSTVNIATDTTLTLGADRTARLWKFGDTSGAQSWIVNSGNKMILAGTTPTIQVNQNTATLGNVVDGSAGLTKTGSGTLALANAANTYTGGTDIQAGTISSIGAASLGSGTATFSGNASIIPAYGVFPSLSNGVAVNTGVTATITSTNQYYGMTFTGPLSGSGTLQVSMANAANTLPNAGFTNSANTFDGTFIATGNGTVRVNSLQDSANPLRLGTSSTFELGSGTATSLAFTNRPLQLTGAAGTSTLTNNNATATISVSQNLAYTSVTGNKTLTLGGSNTGNNLFAGNLANPPSYTLALIKSGAGTWTLSGTNTYSGATQFNAQSSGTLIFKGAASASPNTTFRLNEGCTLALRDDTAGTVVFGAPMQVNLASQQTSARATTNINVNQISTGSGSTLAIGKLNYHGITDYRCSGATVNVAGGNGYKLQIGGIDLSWGISGSQNLNPTTASIIVSGTVIQVSGRPATGTAVGNISSLGTGAQVFTLDGTTTGNLISGAIKNAADHDDASNVNALPLSLTKSGTGEWTLGSTANTFTGTITLNSTTTSAGTLFYASAAGSNPITFLQTTGSATLAYIGAAPRVMSGLITASALTTGTITLDASGATEADTITYSNPSSLTAVSTSTGTRNIVLTGTNTGANTFNGTITNNSGSGGKAALAKNGTGTWVLTGTNTYTGTTTVSAGKLFINGDQTAASGAVNVSANATLGGKGIIGGTTAIAANGKLEFDLSTNAASHDKLELAAGKALNFSGASTLTITSSGGASAGDYTLVTAPGGFGTSVPPATVNLPSGWTADAPRFVGSDLMINITSTGTVGAPEIAVEQPVPTDIPSTGSKNFGNVTLGSNTSLTFTIRNTGTADLNLTGTPLVAVGGTNASDFTVTATPVTPVSSAGGTTTFTVRFAPGAAGTRSALLTILNNDSDEGTFTINLSGTGQTPYDAWSGGAAFDADSNGDGIKNGLAFLLGAADPNVGALGKLPTITQSGGNLVLTFQCLKDASRGNATLSVEHSSNLGITDAWLAAPVTDAGAPSNNVSFSVSSASATLNNVTATISSSEAASGKLFGRLKANP